MLYLKYAQALFSRQSKSSYRINELRILIYICAKKMSAVSIWLNAFSKFFCAFYVPQFRLSDSAFDIVCSLYGRVWNRPFVLVF